MVIASFNVTRRNPTKLKELKKELTRVKKKLPSCFKNNITNPTLYVSFAIIGAGIKTSKKESSSICGSYKKYFSKVDSYIKEFSKYLFNVITVLDN